MKIFGLDSAQSYSVIFQRSSGEETIPCPKCSSDRKKKNLKVFSWNHDEKVGKCHHCDERFVPEPVYKKEYSRPVWQNKTELSDRVIKWFEGRGISQFAIRKLQITEGKEWIAGKENNTIHFNYFRNGDLVNIKYRDGAKNFKLFKDAELIPYNLDGINGTDTAIIVEGEMDVLAMWECGFHNTVSVPNGANWDWLDNSIDYFEEKDKIILATDMDVPGVKLRSELSKRLGIERCYKVDFGEHKDANDVLIKNGKDALIDIINKAQPFPIEGVFSLNDNRDELDLLLENGLQPGKTLNESGIDKMISFETARLYTMSGIPGHGKSEVLDYLLCKLNVLHGWKVGYFSPENHPMEWHLSKLIEKISGVKFVKSQLSQTMYNYICDYVNDNFFFVYPQSDFTIDSILEKARYLVRRKGIKAFVIDPYNKLEHKYRDGQNETSYVSEFLDKLLMYAKTNDVAVFLVAHPRKMQKIDKQYEVPTMYDISGSSHFYNKTDYGLTVYRDFAGGFVSLYVQKVKFKHLGEVGFANFLYNTNNGRLSYFNEDKSAAKLDNNCWIKIDREFPDPDLFIEPQKDIFDGTTTVAPF